MIPHAHYKTGAGNLVGVPVAENQNYCSAAGAKRLTQTWRIMKLTFILIIAACLQVSANRGYTQAITLAETNASIETVFKKIKTQTGFLFWYDDATLAKAKPVNINVKNVPLLEVLKLLFKEQPQLTYSVQDKFVVVKVKEGGSKVSELVAVADTVQSRMVTGKVLDSAGRAIQDVSVTNLKTRKGTTTDKYGNFAILADDNDVIEFSFVGMETKRVMARNINSGYAIRLGSSGVVEEVVTVVSTGYQDIPKERATGSFVKIDNELFNRRIGATVLDRLSDITSGLLQVNPPGGNVNPLDDIVIRGVSTINASKRPLLVVDNFIYDGDPNTINPNDIQSVTVLKDAAAASIWGVRAGNGVIVLTTKKGRFNQRPTVSFNTNITIKDKPDLFYIPAIPSKDIIALEKKRFADSVYNDYDDVFPFSKSYPALNSVPELLLAVRRGKITQAEADAQIQLLENHDIRNDISKHLLQRSVSQQYALNLSGGSSSYQYYGSLGYDYTRPNNKNIHSDRLTIRFNSTWKPISKLEVTGEIVWGQSNYSSKNSMGGYDAVLNNPYARLTDGVNALAVPNTYRLPYVDSISYKGLLDWHYRPLDEINNGNQRTRAYDTRIVAGVNYNLLPGLTASVNYQWQKILTDNKIIQSMETYYTRNLINRFVNVNSSTGLPVYPIPLGDIYNQTNIDQYSWNLRGQINFTRSWHKHSISSIAGVEKREVNTGSVQIPTQYGYNPQTYTFAFPLYGDWTIRPEGFTNTISPVLAGTRGTLNRYGSYYINAVYAYNNRYILSGSGRIDQSNFFGVKANDRIVPLWSVGVLWDIAKEDFYSWSWLTVLKLRASLGYNGNVNAGTSPLATASYFNPVSPLFTPYATLQTSPNPQLRWERIKNLNVGLDFEIQNGQINGSVEFYQKTGLNLISQISADPTNGFITYTGNNASVKGNGLDLSVTSRNINGTLKWMTSLLFSYNTEKVTKYNVQPPTQGGGYLSNPIIIGKPLQKLYSYQWAGLNPGTGDAQLYINKQIIGSSGFLNARPEDMVYGGRTTPAVFGFLRNDFYWKNFSLSMGINYRFGYYFRRSSFTGNLSIDNANGGSTWAHEDYLKAWQKSGDELHTDVPGFLESYSDNRYAVYSSSTILVEKGDHIRLQDIRLSYDVNNNKMRLPFQRIQFYAYVNNIGILWRANDKGIDPEAYSFGSIPQPKSIAIGVNVGF